MRNPLFRVAGVLIPPNRAVDERSRGDVDVAVPVEVSGGDAEHEVGGIVDHGALEGAVAVGVAVDRHRVVAVGGANDVDVAVLVDVERNETVRAERARVDYDFAAKSALPVQVAVPGKGVIIFGSTRQIEVAVRIKVSADDGADPDHRIVHNVLDFAKGAVDAEIAKPGDGVVARRSGDDVEITVPVNVSKMDSLRVEGGVCDRIHQHRRRPVAGVLEPGDRVVVVRGRDDVWDAVAVQIARRNDACAV
mmetsp:Transcript_20430/g.44394  ORF Transcript_20430/g.44394 Transcript_20430/m.44394 type:complete len:249 (-) Transcript_20430:637-1383(-)